MWSLKIGKESVGEAGTGAWLRSLNHHVGRQVWEFCPELGTPEELSKVEMARQTFRDHRFHKKHTSDLLMRIQVCLAVKTSNWVLLFLFLKYIASFGRNGSLPLGFGYWFYYSSTYRKVLVL